VTVAQFKLFDCGLVRQAAGVSCSNLRDLLAAVRTASDGVIEHHMMRCVLEDDFELHEFPNDFARWCWSALGDHALGEELGLIDPYRHATIPALRATLEDTIDRQLWTTDATYAARPGLEMHLVESRLVAYDTGERFAALDELAVAIGTLPLRSLFYHVHEGRRRTEGRTDDFSAWLEAIGTAPEVVTALRGLDFYFLNLNQLREEIGAVLHRHLRRTATARVPA
jgi:Family of unknown function (DUF5752)